MSNLVYLNSNNFEIIGVKNKALGLRRIQEPMLVFFKMTGCDNCKKFEPIFISLTKTDNRISYGILNVSDSKDVVMWSRQTTTPITAVPTLIMYLGGQPYARYNGTTNIPSLRNFITETLKSGIQQRAPPMPQGGGMYDSVGGPANYSPQNNQQNKKTFMPEMGSAPSMKGAIKGYASTMEEDEDNRLRIPNTVTPWNTPWEAEINNY